MIRFCAATILCLLCFLRVDAQQTARDKIEAGAKLVDEGKYDDALILLREGAKMEPENYHWAYEVAFAYYSKKAFKMAIIEYEKVVAMPEADAQCYAMLGNSYDYSGDSTSAKKTYEDALKKFPDAGFLWVELGNMKLNRKDYSAALSYYESGIKADPGFASNYFRAAKLYLNSNKKVWGMIYGEAFMNLEGNSERTAEMSKMLYDTYRSSIHVNSDTNISVSFDDNVINADDLIDKNGKTVIPFSMKVYEPNILLATLLTGNKLDIPGLVQIREKFLVQYYEQKLDKEYPNEVLIYQKRITDSGHSEAYHRWILMKGDETAFDTWVGSHQNTWNDFIKWFSENRIILDKAHHLVKN